ncbi:MAG: peptidase S16 [Gammaproteobacteria bacterium]|nr:peptidase S16 [Gammaproteobacteria bacterium]
MTGEIPLFPLKAVLFPGGPLPLRIFEPRYVDMVGRCMREDSGFGVVLIREGEETGPAQFHEVGTLARVVDFSQLPEGLLGLSTLGERRFRVREHHLQSDGLNVGEIEWLADEPPAELPAQYRHLAEVLAKVLPELGEHYTHVAPQPDDASWVGYRLAEILPLTPESRQFCLELEEPIERLRLLDALITQQST